MAQTQYPWDQPIETRKFPVKTAVISAVLALALIIAAFLILKPAPVREIVIPRELAANAVMASFVDNNFNYGLQANSEYLQGEGIYIYIEAINFNQTSDFRVDVTQDLEIRDSTGNVVFSREDFGVLKQTYTGKVDIVRFRNIVPTLTFNPGRYTATVTVNDNLVGKSTRNVLSFKIREKSKEILEKTVDLSKIVPAGTTTATLVKQQTVLDPSGKLIPELSFSQPITGDLSGIDLTKILLNVNIPERFDAGVYTVEVKYTNQATGQSVSVKDTVTVVKQLSIDQFVFASYVDANYVYAVQPNNEYEAGSDIHVYLRLVDFAQPFVNGKYNTNFTEDIIILDSNGNEAFSQSNYIIINNANDAKKDSYNIRNVISSGDPGQYTLKVIIKDLNSGQQTTREETFTLT